MFKSIRMLYKTKFISSFIVYAATALLLVSTANAEKINCFVEGKEWKYSQDSPRCLFFTGTQHYRNKEYIAAANNWEALLERKDISSMDNALLISAHNNLGFLYFHGLGVNQNAQKGLEHWKKAILMGSEESEYHLCYAYGASTSPIHSPMEAIPHCNKAEKIYLGKEVNDQDDIEMLDTIRKYRAIAERALNQ